VVRQELNNAELINLTRDVVFAESITQDGKHVIIAGHLHHQQIQSHQKSCYYGPDNYKLKSSAVKNVNIAWKFK